MKKILIPISTLLITGLGHAQTTPSSTENYVYTRTYLSDPSLPNPKTSEAVQYFDGLGRPKQVVNVKASPLGKDVVTPVVYDQFGRQRRDYLPVPQSGTQNGALYTQNPGQVPFPVADATGIYNGEKTYSEKILEDSPLDRVQQQIQVGNDWSGKPVTFDYGANTAGDAVKKYVTSTAWVNVITLSTLSVPGTYGASQLYKNTVTDEDGNKTIEFKNSQGQVILVRKLINETEKADIYYVYNEYGQLAFVLPPLASLPASPDQAALDNLCYQYRYDGKGRLVEKKLPGKGWEYMVYDKADRLVMTQDANMRPSGKWLFTKYDQFSRPVYTGTANIGAQHGRRPIQESLDYYLANGYLAHEERNTSGLNNSGMTVYYTGGVYPFESLYDKILSVNYYDTYPSGSPSSPLQVMGQEVLKQPDLTSPRNTRSLALASYAKNIEDDSWTKSYTWYDTKGRPVGTHSINHLGGYTKTETELDFAGLAKQSKTYHKRLNSDAETIIAETFEYDHQNRLKKHWHKVDSNPQVLLTENTYNELSQLTNKKVGDNLQSIDYQYNIRGWMTRINDPENLNGKLFGYEIRYQNPVNTTLASGRYNGNIAEVNWKTANDGVLRRYNYRYDPLNRLTHAHYREPLSSVPQNNFYNEETAYDLNGNITRLWRNTNNMGTATLIDNLTYNYTGNRLTSVTDASTNYKGYPDVSGNTISYDDNGNMKDQIDKGILQLHYNFLNLPMSVVFDQMYYTRGVWQNVNSRYFYGSDGRKLRKEYRYSENSVYVKKTTDYLDGFQYEEIQNVVPFTLKFVPTSEGYYNFENNKYIYNYTDHLGNVRLSYMNGISGTEIIEENNYYPFGLKHEGYNQLAGNPNYQYKYQGQELQETGFYSFKWRNYMPDVGRFFNIDPLAAKYPYNSTYAFQENKLGMGVELEGLELLKNHTGFFAIHGNAMKVKRAPVSQADSNGKATFTAGDIGLTTKGYNPSGARITDGTTGLRLPKYDGATASEAKMESVRGDDRPTNIWTKTYDKGIDKMSKFSSGVKELVKNGAMLLDIPKAFKSLEENTQASKDIQAINSQAMTMDRAIQYVDQSGIEMNQQTRNDVINYVFDGTLPNPDAGLMPNSLIIQNGTQILRDNKLPIQPLDQQLTTKSRDIQP
ncbi:RHS repeat-associated protein [Chryseobacterium defluvii]|uniref:RHS repeat-associated protein n=1 Tax=Chryseobacterium defluvii TaxID=160396 RepID=A0A840KJT9_9FLAO|nr:DUF6443 domain-containing protein [Chryseobacterium defluvii]MBB4808298.1 RHS repeat-associated protein [Chryseobacterium defluvii]